LVLRSREPWHYVFRASAEEAANGFREDFVVLWDQIASAPDQHLTEDAIQVKRAFRRIVKNEERLD
jgi:hypothetical protein